MRYPAALARRGVAHINFPVDLQEAAKFAESLAKGTPHAGKTACTILTDQIKEML